MGVWYLLPHPVDVLHLLHSLCQIVAQKPQMDRTSVDRTRTPRTSIALHPICIHLFGPNKWGGTFYLWHCPFYLWHCPFYLWHYSICGTFYLWHCPLYCASTIHTVHFVHPLQPVRPVHPQHCMRFVPHHRASRIPLPSTPCMRTVWNIETQFKYKHTMQRTHKAHTA